MKNLKEVQYSKQKLNSKIIEHFENFGIFEYSESKLTNEIQTEFTLEFEDKDLPESKDLSFLIIYSPDDSNVIDFKESRIYQLNSKGIEVEEVELNLINKNHNPNKESLGTILLEMQDKQDKRDSENEQSAKDILETQDWLNKNR